MPAPCPAAAARLARLARRLRAPMPASTPWSPPALPTLIERIDAALGERRG